MMGVETCPECGVPGHITREHAWVSDGSIVQTRHSEHRMAFLETENLDPLYLGIGSLIGMSIIPLLTNVFRRSTAAYMQKLVPAGARESVRSGYGNIQGAFDLMFHIGRVMGYGKGELLDFRFEGDEKDFALIRYDHPCSKPIIAGSVAGTIEAYVGRSAGLEMKESPGGAIEVRVFLAEHPAQWRKRFWVKRSDPGKGNVDLRRCETCGGPAALRGFTWDFDRGIIRSVSTGRRMSLIGPSILESVISELEDELGAAISEVVIEAQRRFVRGGFYRMEEVSGEEYMREEFALRGLGEVKKVSFSRKAAEFRLANPALHLVVVGLIQGLFELAFGIESKAGWRVDEGDLLVEVTPWG